jgi:hypothetical protein
VVAAWAKGSDVTLCGWVARRRPGRVGPLRSGGWYIDWIGVFLVAGLDWSGAEEIDAGASTLCAGAGGATIGVGTTLCSGVGGATMGLGTTLCSVTRGDGMGVGNAVARFRIWVIGCTHW